MDNFEYLLRLNIEIEGLLRVAECRKSESVKMLLIEKSEEFLATLKAALADCNTTARQQENDCDASAAECAGTADVTAPTSETESTKAEIDKTDDAAAGEINCPGDTRSDSASDITDATDNVAKNKEGDIPETTPKPAQRTNQENETVLEMDIDVSPDEIMVPPAFIPGKQQAKLPDNNSVSAPQHVVRVDEMIQRRSSQDLKKAFTLNDRYKYIREIFDRDPAYFDEVLGHLSQLDTLDEAYDYLLGDISLDHEDETVKEFLSVVFNHFNA